MSGAIPILPNYAFTAWCPVKRKRRHIENQGVRTVKIKIILSEAG
jgi:hypothetical protein